MNDFIEDDFTLYDKPKKPSKNSKKTINTHKSSSSVSAGYNSDGYLSAASAEDSHLPERDRLAKFYNQRMIAKKFSDNAEAVKAIFEDSSDSDDALEPFINTRQYSKIKRREEHKKDIEAIARQASPPDEEMRQFYKATIQQRERDRQSGNTYEFSDRTIDMYKEIGQHAKATNIMHNSLLRKAYKKAIEPDLSISSGISEYESNQTNIRSELLGVIQEDALKMGWNKEDFEDPRIWQVVQHLQSNILDRNDKKPKIAKVVDERDSLEGCTPFASWHHIAFKAARDMNDNKYIAVHALRPDGLMLAHDTRAQNDGSVAEKEYGDHEWMHKITSRSKKSRFSKMDEAAINPVLEQTTTAVTRKREKYALNIIERLENFALNVEPHNMRAKALYDQVSKMQVLETVHDLDKYVKNRLEGSGWGDTLLQQQEIMDLRTRNARLDASGGQSMSR